MKFKIMWKYFHKEIELGIFVLCLFGFVCLAKSHAKPSETNLKDQTIIRMFHDIEQIETRLGEYGLEKTYIIHVMLNSNDELPVLDWNPEVDYYLFYPNGQPTNSPHTTKIHFDLMCHMLDTDIALYKGKSIDHPLGPCVKPCPICQELLKHDN